MGNKRDLPYKLVAVIGDQAAKEGNAQPAYTRISRMREVVFVCRRCQKRQTEARYPGPTPRYCGSCKELVAGERYEERVRKQREQRQEHRARLRLDVVDK